MKTIIEYTKTKETIRFEHIKDKTCFYSGGVLYMKILQQDLKYYKIENVNAISILSEGLTFFETDELVNEAIREAYKADNINLK